MTIRRSAASRLKADPSQTYTLRKRFETEVKRRFNRFKSAILDLVKREDAFGLTTNFNPSQPRDNHGRWSSSGGGQTGGLVSSELGRLQEAFPELNKLPHLQVDVVSKLDMDEAIGLADPQAELGAAYFHGQNKIQIVPSTHVKEGVELGGEVVSLGTPGLLRHEIGHHVQEHAHKVLGPPLNDLSKRISWQNLAQEYIGSDKPSVISQYAKLSHKELYAESFAVFTDPKYKKGSLPKPIEDYFTRLLKPVQDLPTINTRWKFRTNPAKVEEFRKWLQKQAEENLIQSSESTDPNKWWDEYVLEAYRKGQLSSFESVNKQKLGESMDFYKGTKEQFLRDSFAQPEAKEKIQLLAGRVFTDLKGVTEAMATVMTRTLTDGLSQGQNPFTIARQLVKDVEGIGVNRARMIARTEVIRAHAEGQLDSLETMGIEEVGVAVEWDDAGDGRVCRLCSAMDGVVLTVKEAHGLIPRHPNCRCAFLPANVGESKTNQIRGPKGIQGAFDKSIKREIPKGSKRSLAEQKQKTKWGGADTKIVKKRPKAIV